MKRAVWCLTAVALYCLLILPGRALAQPAGWVEFDGHYYRLATTDQTWTDASAEASSLGGYLVAINTAPEQDFLETTFLVGSLDARAVWMGATDSASEGTFVWSSGESFGGYLNWHPGEPNDAGAGEDYGCMNWHRDRSDGSDPKGTWNDCDNNGTARDEVPVPLPGIIERDSAPVPTAGSTWLLAAMLLMMLAGVAVLRRRAMG